MEDTYIKLIKIIENEFSQDTTHTIDHVMRVYRNAMHLADQEDNINMHVLKSAALLHDIARMKEDSDNTGNTDHAILGAEMAKGILRDLGYRDYEIANIAESIKTHRYRSGDPPESKEARILFDADKLDLLGAVGLARIYMFSGEQHQTIYSSISLDRYIKDNLVNGKPNGRIKDISKHASNLEFQTKIRHIPEKLFTSRAREIAKERVKFMEEFFFRLKNEIGENYSTVPTCNF